MTDRNTTTGHRRRRCTVLLLLAMACLCIAPVFAIDALPFRSHAEELRFQALTKELRCLVCQNESLADSGADLAKDLREEVFEQMQSGKNDTEIKRYLVARYGDYVLYNPPVKPATWLLWFGPLLVFGAGAIALVGIVQRRRRALLIDATPVVAQPPADNEDDW